MICKVLSKIELKTPRGIEKLYAGDMFETFDKKSAAYLIKSRKIKLISDNLLLTEQCPQCPQCLQISEKQEDVIADIGFTKSAKSSSENTQNTVPSTSRDQHPDTVHWSDDMMDLIRWFENAPRVQESFLLDDHRHVCDPVKFYDSLMKEIQAGPKTARNRNCALMEDIKKLKKMVDGYNMNINDNLEK